MSWYQPADLGFAVRRKLADIGQGARLFAQLLRLLPPTLRRPALVRDQVHFLGNYSLGIIAVMRPPWRARVWTSDCNWL